jgi:hypothetical protein
MSTKREIYKTAFQDYVTTGQTDHEEVALREVMREQLMLPTSDSAKAQKTLKKILISDPSPEIIARLSTALGNKDARTERVRASYEQVVKETHLLRRAKRIAYMKAKRFMEILRQDPALEPVKEFTIVFGTNILGRSIRQYEIMGKPKSDEFGIALFIPSIHLIAADEHSFKEGKTFIHLGPVTPFIWGKEYAKQQVTLTYTDNIPPNPNSFGQFGGRFTLTTIDFGRGNMQVLGQMQASTDPRLREHTFHSMVDNRYGGYVNGQWKDCSVTVQR